MATRKKKAVVIESADIAEMTTSPSEVWPKVTQGTHLTVTTYEDGRTELKWDDAQLAKEVSEAIASVSVKPKATRKKKVVE